VGPDGGLWFTELVGNRIGRLGPVITPTPSNTPTPTATRTPTPSPSATNSATATPTATTTFTAGASSTPTLSPTTTAAATISRPCPGDCDRSNAVTIDELMVGIDIALGRRPLGECPNMDGDNDGHVTVDDLTKAVNNALNGCD